MWNALSRPGWSTGLAFPLLQVSLESQTASFQTGGAVALGSEYLILYLFLVRAKATWRHCFGAWFQVWKFDQISSFAASRGSCVQKFLKH